MPELQDVQDVAPALEINPAEQARQPAKSFPPTTLSYLPVSQVVQELAEAGAYCPSAQEMQVVASAPLYFPVLHIEQALAPVAAFVPATHLVQTEHPVEPQYLPVSHVVHDVLPTSEAPV